MAALRPLRGGCQCGRNRYIIAMPQEHIEEAQVVFNTEHRNRIPFGSPLAAYIRVPLSWYHSTTHAFFPDETHATIRRVYTHPSQQHSKRQFCGYCGTSFSYWSEQPWSEANYINLTLGSLLREDLRDLEDMGLIPDEAEQDSATERPRESGTLRQSLGVPWFDGMVEGSRLSRISRFKNQNGHVKVEWEVVDFTDGGDSTQDVEMSMSAPGKRKLQDREDVEAGST